mgnify:FL=1
MKKNNKNILDYMIRTIILLSITDIVGGIKIFSYFNKIILIIFVSEFIVYSFRNKYNMKDVFFFYLTIVLTGVALIYTGSFRYDNFNLVFYLPVWMMLFIVFAQNKNEIFKVMERNVYYLQGVVTCWTIIIGISIFLPSSYTKDSVFISLSGGKFGIEPSTLLIVAIVFFLYGYKKEKKLLFYLIMPLYCVFMGASRTYLGVLLILILLFLFIIITDKKKAIFYIACFIGISLLIISYTNIGRKINDLTYAKDSYFDFWGTVTSGRTIFWKWDIDAFMQLPIYKRFIGNGYNFPYDVTYNNGFKRGIWAHNDFLNIIMNYGYIGLVTYLYPFCKFIKVYKKEYSINNIYVCIFCIAIFINSFFNMSYTYICATVSYPIYMVSMCYFLKEYGNERYIKTK